MSSFLYQPYTLVVILNGPALLSILGHGLVSRYGKIITTLDEYSLGIAAKLVMI